jgi:hypothetical protein
VFLIGNIGKRATTRDQGVVGVPGDYQWIFPFDTCTSVAAPISLTNIQVVFYWVNQLQSNSNYTIEGCRGLVVKASGWPSFDLQVEP